MCTILVILKEMMNKGRGSLRRSKSLWIGLIIVKIVGSVTMYIKIKHVLVLAYNNIFGPYKSIIFALR